MKIFVKFRENCVAVPCSDGSKPISWLTEEALARINELSSEPKVQGKVK